MIPEIDNYRYDISGGKDLDIDKAICDNYNRSIFGMTKRSRNNLLISSFSNYRYNTHDLQRILYCAFELVPDVL